MSESYRGPLKVSLTEKHNYCSSTGERRDFKQFWITHDVEKAMAPSITLMSTEYSMNEEDAHYWSHLFAASPKMHKALEVAEEALNNIDGDLLSRTANMEILEALKSIHEALQQARGES